MKPTLVELEAQIAELQETVKKMKEPEEIKLQGGKYYIAWAGNAVRGNSTEECRNAGLEYQTRAQVEVTLKRMRQANRIQARAFEIDPDFVDEFDYTRLSNQPMGKSAYLYNNKGKWKYSANTTCRYLGSPVMSESTAKQICEEINSGRFKI